MTHDAPPELQRVCYPGRNGSCIMLRLGLGTDFALYLVLVFGMLVTVLGNFVVIVSVCHFKQLHNPTNVLISSLAVADLLVAVLVMPFSAVITVQGCWYFGGMFCQLFGSFQCFFPTVSVFHLLFIAVDRYEAICNPLHYSQKITMSVVVIMVCVSWTVTAVYAFGGILSKAHIAGLEELLEILLPNCHGLCYVIYNVQWVIFSSLLTFFLPCFVMICLYTHIFLVAKKHVKKIGDKNTCSNDRGRGGLVKQSENKAAKTLSIVFGAFLFCWTPIYVSYLIPFQLPDALRSIIPWLSYFNSALNPIIYALFYPSFRKCFHCIITLKILSPDSSSMDLSVK